MPHVFKPDTWNFDPFANDVTPNGGFARSIHLPFHFWKKSTGDALLSVASSVNWASVELGTYDLKGLQWTYDADNTDIAYLQTQIPMDYDPKTDKLRLVIRARKYDAGADENANLHLVLNAKWFDSESIGGEQLAAPLASDDLAAATSGTDWDDFEEVIFNLGGNGLKPGALIELQLYPHEQVGTTDMKLDIIASRLDYYGSISHNDKDLRVWQNP